MKKVIYVLGVAVFAVGVFLTTKSSAGSENTTLQNMSTINSVNAECVQQGDMRDNGHCYTLSQHCYWGVVASMPLCDPWAM